MTPSLVKSNYYNDPQLILKLMPHKHKMFVGGRGIGKTTIFADEIVDNAIAMPRAKFGFMGLTYFHVRTKSMPAIIKQLEARGLYRDIHYFIGHKAPKKYKFPEPYLPPLDYKNCIHFWNGTVVEFISFDRPEMARSGSYDFFFGDEAAKLKHSALVSDVLPANRGNGDKFGHVPQHNGTLFATTMPLDQQGQWVFEYEEKMEEFPEEYLYLEAPSTENIKVLGEQYFRDLKRSMPEAIYSLEILNIRRELNIKTFYPTLSQTHFYPPVYDYSFIDGKEVYSDKQLKAIDDCRKDGDLNMNRPLDVSFDFGANINCCVVGQESTIQYRLLKNFYTEKPLILNDLLKLFCDYYKYHKKKVIYLYGGSDGRKSQANSVTTLFQDVNKYLSKEGWTIVDMYREFEVLHMDKYRFYYKYLSGTQVHIKPLGINNDNCRELIVSMQDAPMVDGEFKKDKKSEKNDNIPQWKATHLSDAADNLLYWKFNHLIDADTYYDGPMTGTR